MSGGQTIIIGLDGVPYGMLKSMLDNGIMPEMSALLEKGGLYKISSTLPEISSVSWSSIITGENPAQHGIMGFTDLAPTTYATVFPNFNSIKSAPFWLNDDFSPRNDKRIAALNVPATYPAKEMNGIHIAGFVALDMAKAVYPQNFITELERTGYKIDVDAYKAHESMSLFLRDLDKTLDSRISAAEMIYEKEQWDIFMLVFTGTDRLGHFLYDAFENEDHQYREDFMNHFRKIDSYIGKLASSLGQGDRIAFLSDHGMEHLDYEVHINKYLHEWGYLKLRSFPANSYNDIAEGTVAFCMDPGRIYLNYEGRYPRGSVKTEDAEKICSELAEQFRSLEVEGRKAVSEIFLKDDIFNGQLKDKSPDMVLLGAKGLDLKGTIKGTEFFAKNIFTGKHSYHDAFFGIYDPSSEKDSYAEIKTVTDFRKILTI